MVTSDDLSEAWKQGYIKGWQTIKPTIPSIPTRTASYPAGIMDPITYFYNKGFELGKYNASIAP